MRMFLMMALNELSKRISGSILEVEGLPFEISINFEY